MFLAWEAIPTGPGLPAAPHTSAGQLGAVDMSAPSLYTNEEMTVAFLWLPPPLSQVQVCTPSRSQGQKAHPWGLWLARRTEALALARSRCHLACPYQLGEVQTPASARW